MKRVSVLFVCWCFHRKMQIIAKNQNGNGLIFGIPQRAAVFQLLLYVCFCFSKLFSALETFCALYFCLATGTERQREMTKGECERIVLVIFA